MLTTSEIWLMILILPLWNAKTLIYLLNLLTQIPLPHQLWVKIKRNHSYLITKNINQLTCTTFLKFQVEFLLKNIAQLKKDALILDLFYISPRLFLKPFLKDQHILEILMPKISITTLMMKNLSLLTYTIMPNQFPHPLLDLMLKMILLILVSFLFN